MARTAQHGTSLKLPYIRKERGKDMIEVKRKVSETMTVFDAKRWQAMGYELEIENGEVTKISKRKAPHVPEHEAAVRCDV